MMTYTAALPWYNFCRTRAALDAIWHSLRASLHDCLDGSLKETLPEGLDHHKPYATGWHEPDLLLSQCCGLDLFHAGAAHLVPLAVPVMSALVEQCGVKDGHYCSHIVSRGARCWTGPPTIAINNAHSHSGNTALRVWLHAAGYPKFAVVETGSHAASVAALQAGVADVAAIDAYSWQYIDAPGLTVIDRSLSAWAPPFVTGAAHHIARADLLAALQQAVTRHGPQIGWSGVVPVSRRHFAAHRKQAISVGIL